jgi:hypothetical protein
MLPSAAELRVPVAQRDRIETIFVLTDAVCHDLLDGECAELCRRLAARLARKRPSPLAGGRPEGWAAGTVYAIARLNFLFDLSQTPHISADAIAQGLGVAKSTAAAKATRIETVLGLRAFEPDLSRRAMVDQHPLAWLVSVDGFLVDARSLPVVLQEQAHRQGLIPFVPGDASAAAA